MVNRIQNIILLHALACLNICAQGEQRTTSQEIQSNAPQAYQDARKTIDMIYTEFAADNPNFQKIDTQLHTLENWTEDKEISNKIKNIRTQINNRHWNCATASYHLSEALQRFEPELPHNVEEQLIELRQHSYNVKQQLQKLPTKPNAQTIEDVRKSIQKYKQVCDHLVRREMRSADKEFNALINTIATEQVSAYKDDNINTITALDKLIHHIVHTKVNGTDKEALSWSRIWGALSFAKERISRLKEGKTQKPDIPRNDSITTHKLNNLEIYLSWRNSFPLDRAVQMFNFTGSFVSKWNGISQAFGLNAEVIQQPLMDLGIIRKLNQIHSYLENKGIAANEWSLWTIQKLRQGSQCIDNVNTWANREKTDFTPAQQPTKQQEREAMYNGIGAYINEKKQEINRLYTIPMAVPIAAQEYINQTKTSIKLPELSKKRIQEHKLCPTPLVKWKK